MAGMDSGLDEASKDEQVPRAYSAESITVLEGLQAVRVRPAACDRLWDVDAESLLLPEKALGDPDGRIERAADAVEAFLEGQDGEADRRDVVAYLDRVNPDVSVRAVLRRLRRTGRAAVERIGPTYVYFLTQPASAGASRSER